MTLTLASLSRSELISLIEHAGVFGDPESLKEGWRAVLQERLQHADATRSNAYARWLPLSRTAEIDARAAREWIERNGYDRAATGKLQESKRSTRAASEAWDEVRAADLAREKIARQLRLVGRL